MKIKNNLLKNLGKVTLVLSVMLISSCGDDDAQDLLNDVACENQTTASRLSVEGAIIAYDANQNQATCESLRQLIEAYRDFECIPDDVFAAEYDALPADCADAGN
ncbi:hypothetical protein [Aquimarina sp. 2201CG14-23]|uniref:hypothetical protein n=1 Tax=Aquimarina mycalae TaxID=3040073 RepID=UPI0024781261|nr:hypothetical protein [Aquimarina sp. 2201CG14-23]MDH7448223.1 hypothetical protein [Aquimarina sp. 2201CG14-23]